STAIPSSLALLEVRGAAPGAAPPREVRRGRQWAASSRPADALPPRPGGGRGVEHGSGVGAASGSGTGGRGGIRLGAGGAAPRPEVSTRASRPRVVAARRPHRSSGPAAVAGRRSTRAAPVDSLGDARESAAYLSPAERQRGRPAVRLRRAAAARGLAAWRP